MPDRAEARHHQLVETLHDAYGHLGITDLRQIGQGMDAGCTGGFPRSWGRSPSS
jgi:hypothetical protein